jgi:CRISPR/Cas system-associated endonuclease/helicase Cas3
MLLPQQLPQLQQVTATLPTTFITKLRLATNAQTTVSAMVKEHVQLQVSVKELQDLICQHQLTQRQSGTLLLRAISNTP